MYINKCYCVDSMGQMTAFTLHKASFYSMTSWKLWNALMWQEIQRTSRTNWEHCSPWPDILMHNYVDTSCDLHMYDSFSKMLTPCPNPEQCHYNFFPFMFKAKVTSQSIRSLKIRRYYLCGFSHNTSFHNTISQCAWCFRCHPF